MKYRMCLKSLETGEIRVRDLKLNQNQVDYYSKYIGQAIEGYKILWLDKIEE